VNTVMKLLAPQNAGNSATNRGTCINRFVKDCSYAIRISDTVSNFILLDTVILDIFTEKGVFCTRKTLAKFSI